MVLLVGVSKLFIKNLRMLHGPWRNRSQSTTPFLLVKSPVRLKKVFLVRPNNFFNIYLSLYYV